MNPVIAKAFGAEVAAIKKATNQPVHFRGGVPVHAKGKKPPTEAPYVDNTERKRHSFVEEEDRTRIG